MQKFHRLRQIFDCLAEMKWLNVKVKNFIASFQEELSSRFDFLVSLEIFEYFL